MPRTKRKPRTDTEVVAQTNDLARLFYKAQGYVVPEGYRFDKAHHPMEVGQWNLACIAQKVLTDTDPQDALDNIGE